MNQSSLHCVTRFSDFTEFFSFLSFLTFWCLLVTAKIEDALTTHNLLNNQREAVYVAFLTSTFGYERLSEEFR